MKKLLTLLAMGLTLGLGNAHAADDTGCAAKAAEKKLAGAAKASFEKKCMADAASATAPAASAACEKSAADKKLAGAAKKSHLKKCMADEGGAAKPAATAASAPKK